MVASWGRKIRRGWLLRSTDVGSGEKKQLGVFFGSPRDQNEGLGLGNKLHLKN